MAAGLTRGDVIVKVNDAAVQKSSQVEAALKKIKKPARVKLDILRKSAATSVVVDLR
jgi:S1-C subfamily serine protease